MLNVIGLSAGSRPVHVFYGGEMQQTEKKQIMDSEYRPCVVIVGAGMAGMSAARHLADTGKFDVVVLEANPGRYGGRIHSIEVPMSGGKVAEMGASWIHGGTNLNNPIRQLCQRFNLKTVEYHIWKPRNVMAFDEQGREMTEHGNSDILESMSRLEEAMATCKEQLLKSNSPDISVETFLCQLAKEDPQFVNKEIVQQIALPALENYNAAILADISMKFADGVPNSPESEEIEGEDVAISSGYKSLLDKITTTGRHFPVLLDRRVERITIDQNISKVLIVSSDHQNHRYEHTVDHVIVAVSLGVLKARSIHFQPNLSPSHLAAIDRIGFGSKIRCLLVYEEAFWPDVNIMYVNDRHWPIYLLNLRRVNGLNALYANFDPVESHLLETMPDMAIFQLRMVDALAKIVGEVKMRGSRLIYSKVKKWTRDPFVKGAYSFGKIGMRTEDAYAIRQSISPHVFFAGEHTQFPEGDPGTVVAAYMSGQRAAREILSVYRDNESNSGTSKM